MNIIKFTETIIRDTSIPDRDWYNEKLRGKYAYWVRCRYVIPLDAISKSSYSSYEKDINNLFGETYYALQLIDNEYTYVEVPIDDISDSQKSQTPVTVVVPPHPVGSDPELIKTISPDTKYIDLGENDEHWMNEYIDWTETNNIINRVDVLIQANKYVPEDVETIDIKNFRTWLAEVLYDITNSWTVELKKKINWSDEETHMLLYYINGMYDDILKWLNTYAKKSTEVVTTNINSCGCSGNSDLSSLYIDSIHVCDPESIYRQGIKNVMISVFSNMEFWTLIPEGTLRLIKTYIDGIITRDLPFTSYDSDVYAGCDCLGKSTAQDVAMSTLKKLSLVFEYFANGTLTGNKNFMSSTLTDWATNLYEIMQWN